MSKKYNNIIIMNEIVVQFYMLESQEEQFIFLCELLETAFTLFIRSYLPRTLGKGKIFTFQEEKLSPNVIDLNQQDYSYEQIEKYGIVKQKGKRGLTDVYAYFIIEIQKLLQHKYGLDNLYMQLLESNPYYAKQLMKIKKLHKYNYLNEFTFFELIQFIQKLPNKGRLLDLCYERLNYKQVIYSYKDRNNLIWNNCFWPTTGDTKR